MNKNEKRLNALEDAFKETGIKRIDLELTDDDKIIYQRVDMWLEEKNRKINSPVLY